MKKWLFFILLSSFGFALNHTPYFEATLNEVMSATDQKKTGIDKLTKQERKQLQVWLQNYSLAASNDSLESQTNFKPFVSTLTINAYAGEYIVLTNNTVWHVRPEDMSISSMWLAPVRIKVTLNLGDPYPFTLTNLLTNRSVNAKKTTWQDVPKLKHPHPPIVPKQEKQNPQENENSQNNTTNNQ